MNKSVSGPAGDIVLVVAVRPVRNLFIYLFIPVLIQIRTIFQYFRSLTLSVILEFGYRVT